ncbi:ImmA/IrrE family metallo-endopeptidase [Anaerosinus massiliensis]|uniref:ImmA/IrrE family metallo-endopeptidase n=1 Tax=Massilibacillus massiliensis TaxID=1806837 RepID=UPI000DA605CB|nr:ImmA/IrrE family metallo-endopeptidase [Massilibacillus massiliensis]
MNIPLRVRNLVNKHGTSNPLMIAADLNIDVITYDLPVSIRGFLLKVLRRKIIFINNNLAEVQQLIVLCHELGHARLHSGYGYYLHPDMTYYVSSSREHEANEYALNLLMYSHNVDYNLAKVMLDNLKTAPKLVHKMLSELATYDDFC